MNNWSDWRKGGYRGPPPVRRGFQPWLFVVSFVLFAGLLALFVFAFTGHMPI